MFIHFLTLSISIYFVSSGNTLSQILVCFFKMQLEYGVMLPKLLVSKRTVINFKNTRILFKDMFLQDLCHLQFTECCL